MFAVRLWRSGASKNPNWSCQSGSDFPFLLLYYLVLLLVTWRYSVLLPFDEIVWWIFWQFFWQIFWANFWQIFEELFDNFFTNFLVYNILTIASSRIGVPSILFIIKQDVLQDVH